MGRKRWPKAVVCRMRDDKSEIVANEEQYAGRDVRKMRVMQSDWGWSSSLEAYWCHIGRAGGLRESTR
jgi:hypothetical protein